MDESKSNGSFVWAPGIIFAAKTAGEGSHSSFNGRTKRVVCRRCFEHKRTRVQFHGRHADRPRYYKVVVLQLRNGGYVPVRHSPTKPSAASPASSQGSLASRLALVSPPKSFAFFLRSSTPAQLSSEKTILTMQRTERNPLCWV